MKKALKIVLIFFGVVFLIFFGILLALYSPEKKVEKLEKKYFTSTSQYLDLADARYHLNDQGLGDAIFLLHGSFSSLHTWEAWEATLSQSYRTISLDLPGHGLTGPVANGDYSTDRMAKDIIEISEKLGIQRFHIVGNSMGGMVAGKVAELASDKVQSLGLVNAAGFQRAPATSADTATASPASSPNLIFSILRSPFWSKVVTRFTPKFLFRTAMKQVYHDDEKITEELVQRYYDLLLREGNRLATIQRMGQMRSKVDWANIQSPTLILWGRHDTWIPWHHGEGLNKLIPNSTLKIYEDAGHVPMEEIPEECVKDYLEFLRGQ